EKEVDAAVWDFPGLGHGPMFNASFRSALLDISREKAERVPDCH
ncbi:Salmochelin siderophore protein IroE, partial [Klebsiella pneumoniae]|nr:Salmochelin siderophore protein IroE [Klebsiella pneumoniae]